MAQFIYAKGQDPINLDEVLHISTFESDDDKGVFQIRFITKLQFNGKSIILPWSFEDRDKFESAYKKLLDTFKKI